MALSERTINKHNIKRAEVFAARGLNVLDVQYAHPAFSGFAQAEQDCSLCGHRHIKWLFSIRFDAPQGIVALAKIETGIDRDSEVTLHPVGSKCIQDWLDAVPESAEKLEALKRWSVELEKCKQAMKAKVVEDLCIAAGFESPLDAFEAYTSLSQAARWSLRRQDARRLVSNAFSIKHKRASRGTVKLWLGFLEAALSYEAALYAPQQQLEGSVPEGSPAPKVPSEDELLLERGHAAWVNRDRLTTYHQDAFTSMNKQATKRGGFVSAAQRSFFVDLLKKLEA